MTEKKRKSLSQRFAQALPKPLRRGIFATMLGIGLFAGEKAQAQERNIAKPISRVVTPVPSMRPAGIDSLLRENPQLLNDLLLLDARLRFPEVAHIAETAYSVTLDSLETAFNAYLDRNEKSLRSSVDVLDPYKIDAMLALGLPKREAVRTALHMETGREDTLAHKWLQSAVSISRTVTDGSLVYTNSPMAVFVNHYPVSPVVILPTDESATTFRAPGLTLDQNIMFINLHEGWHAYDSYTAEFFMEGTLDVNALVLRRETLADIGAAGDMVHAGADIGIIGAVARYRMAHGYDVVHMTSMGLEGLAKEIDRMGLTVFRAMDEAQRAEFYVHTEKNYGMTRAIFKQSVRYNTGGGALQTAMKLSSIFSKETRQAIRFNNITAYGMWPVDQDARVKMRVRTWLHDWDALKTLKDRAFTTDGIITPFTMISAYAALMTEYRKAITTDPDKAIYHEVCMQKMKTAFIEDLRSVDFAEENSRRGLDLRAVIDAVSKPVPPQKLSPSI
jgi:hypothetical protein